MKTDEYVERVAELSPGQSIVVVTNLDNSMDVVSTFTDDQAAKQAVQSRIGEVADRQILGIRAESSAGTLLTIDCD